MLGHCVVHGVAEDDIRLAGCKAGFDEFLEQGTGIDGAADFTCFGAAQVEFFASADGFHKFVGQQHAMVQVQRLTVEVARWFADFEELFDFGVANIQIARRRSATQRTLRNRKCQAVHDADKRNDAAGLAIQANRLANATDIAPIGANAAAARRQPDIFVPGVDDAFKAVVYAVQIAADRQATARAAIGQYGRCRHEPQARDIVIKTLRMRLIIGISRRNTCEKVLIVFIGQQITVLQRVLAEFGQQGIACGIGDDIETTHVNGLARRRRLGCNDLRLCRFSYFFKHICHHSCGHVVRPLACIPEIHFNL